MEKYYFEGVTPDGKTVSGSIEAETEEEARSKAAQSGVSVLSIGLFDEASPQAAAQTQPQTDKKVFEFTAVDDEGADQNGTIEEASEYEAYKRLRSEYGFTITSLVPAGLSPLERVQYKEKGIPPEYEEKYKAENPEPVKKEEPKKAQPKVDETEKILKEKEKEIAFIHEKVDEAIEKVTNLIQEYDQYLNFDKKREIQERIDLLSRLKQSNAIDHLKKLTDRLMAKLKDDTLFIEASKMEGMSQEDWEKSRTEFAQFSNKFADNLDKGFSEVQSLLANVDTEKLKQQVEDVRLPRKLYIVTMYTFIFLFGLSACFWLWILAQTLISLEPSFTNYFWQSGSMWYITFLSAVVGGCMALGFYAPQFQEAKNRILLASAGSALLILGTIEFPLLFFWT